MEPNGTNLAQAPFSPRVFPSERRSSRQRVHLPAYANLDGSSNGTVVELSEILDISEHGIGIQASQPLTVNSTVSVGLDLPQTKSYIQTSGRVVWSDRFGKAGLCFPEMSRVSSHRLKEWLLANATAGNAIEKRTGPSSWNYGNEEDDLMCELRLSEAIAKRREAIASTPNDQKIIDPVSKAGNSRGVSKSENGSGKRNGGGALAAAPSKSKPPSAPDYALMLAALRDVKKRAQSSEMTLEKVLQLAAERAQTLTFASGAAIALKPSDGQSSADDVLICYASSGRDAPDLGARLRAGSGFSGECVSTGTLLRCDDSEIDERVDRESCRRLGIRSMVAVPIKNGEGVIGILEVFSPRQSAFSDAENVALQNLSELIASAVDRDANPVQGIASESAALPFNSYPGLRTNFPGRNFSLAAYAPYDPRVWFAGLDRKSRNVLFGSAAALIGIVLLGFIVNSVRSGPQTESQPATAPDANSPTVSVPVAPHAASTLSGLRNLANQGDATAQFALGARYAIGDGVKQDYSEALTWFSRAAEQGHVTSQATLGAYYWAGRGVPQDLSKAYFWALLAEAGGDQGSRYRLPVLASRLSKSQIAEAQRQADAWMKKSHDGSASTKLVSSKNDLSARSQKKPTAKSTPATDQAPDAEDKQSGADASAAPSLSDLGVELNPDRLAGIVSPIPATLPANPGTEALRISQGSAQALLIKKVQPAYPKQALQARRQGSVQLQATVTKEGKVSNVKTLSGDPLLARAAIDAVKQWEYKPYYLNGQPTEVQTQITVNFRLP